MLAGFGVLINYPFDANVELPRFLIGVAFASTGFSAACALLIAIFSKILQDQEQGLMMGYLSTAGSAARMIGTLISFFVFNIHTYCCMIKGPIGASYILDYVGGSLVFLITVALLVTSFILTLVCWTKLHTQGSKDYQEQEIEKKKSSKRKIKQQIRKKKREIRFAVEEDKTKQSV